MNVPRLDSVSGPPSHLAVLAHLDQPQPVSELAAATRLPLDTVYKAVRTLQQDGVLATHREGRQLVATCTSKPLPSLARALLHDYARSDWSLVLHGDRPTVLHVLNRVRRPELAAEVCGKARSTIYHTTKALGPRGILVRKRGGYVLNPRLGPLRLYLDELAEAKAHHRASALDPAATLLWFLGPELLLRSRKELRGQDVHVGALSAFAEHDVELFTGDAAYYHVATRRLDVADAILQGLLVDPESQINRSYGALVYEKERPDSLLGKAPIYGLEREAEALIRYVTTHEPGDLFLPWREHQRYRSLYGVRS